MTGTAGADHFVGTRERDVIVALRGDDLIEDVGSDDRVCAGAGQDVIRSELRGDAWVIEAGPGDDRVLLFQSSEIFGGPGADHIVVDQGVGGIRGGPGDDFMRVLSEPRPRDYVENAPCLDYGGSLKAVRVNLAARRARGEGRDTPVGFHCVYGSRFGDVIVGTSTRDGAWGRAGYDILRMRAGSDSADGGLHADRIYLGPGLDYANGEQGWDRLYGGVGEDDLEGWTDGDYLRGGPGNDQLYAALFCAIGGNSYDTAGLLDDAGNELFGGLGDDYLVGDKGNDRLEGGPGYDHVQPGYRDGRIDWIESTEELIEGCLEFSELKKLFKQPGY